MQSTHERFIADDYRNGRNHRQSQRADRPQLKPLILTHPTALLCSTLPSKAHSLFTQISYDSGFG